MSHMWIEGRKRDHIRHRCRPIFLLNPSQASVGDNQAIGEVVASKKQYRNKSCDFLWACPACF